MHGRFDRSDETSDKSIYRRWGIGVFLLPVLLVAFLIGLAVTKPDVSALISDAVQAELVSSGQATGGDSGAGRATSQGSTHRQGSIEAALTSRTSPGHRAILFAHRSDWIDREDGSGVVCAAASPKRDR